MTDTEARASESARQREVKKDVIGVKTNRVEARTPPQPTVESWGRLATSSQHLLTARDPDALRALVREAQPGLAHGMGRSYGDACLNPGGTLWHTTGLNHLISFDPQTGRLRCEAGVLLRDLQRLIQPRGWRLPVTPGTQLITLGGAIANDVHGKNHHRFGTFGDHVQRMRILRTDGEEFECSRDERADFFFATIGGLGLTGVIVDIEMQLQPVGSGWLDTETLPFDDVDEFLRLADASEADWEHTASWIDCVGGKTGRGLFLRGRSAASPGPAPKPGVQLLSVPFVPPLSLINPLSLRLFNEAYYRLSRWRAGPATVSTEKFLHPLDGIGHWNRLYGPRGFYQYQCVLPRPEGEAALKEMLSIIRQSGDGSFLAVLKTFGERRPEGMLSFPMPGITLALDFPNRGQASLGLFDELDRVVAAVGGRLYAAKDARMPRELFESGYPRLPEFLPFRDPGITSGLSRRLMGH